MTSQILIVDDELFMLRLIEASLKKGGFAVTACRSGDEAIAMANRNTPDLIIIDLMMPGRDGLATLRVLKESAALREVPAILLTAKGRALVEHEAAESGVEVFLTKPFSPSQLLEHVRRLLAAQPAAKP
jgi:CheY-like chemotaxis protein